MLGLSQADTKKAEDAKVYLGLPATWAEVEVAEKQTGKQFHHPGVLPVTKDTFHIATLTCSTKLTQNGAASCSPPAVRSRDPRLLSCFQWICWGCSTGGLAQRTWTRSCRG